MERTATVVPEDGPYARPASKFVETVSKFDTDIQLGRVDEDDLVPAANMLTVIGLGIGHNESARLVAEDDDAEVALDALENILSTPKAKQ